MKNMHETRFWNNVKSRLERYSEEPDDDWDAIASRIPSRNNGWLSTSRHLFTLVALLSFLFLLHPDQWADDNLMTDEISGKKISGPIASDSSDSFIPHSKIEAQSHEVANVKNGIRFARQSNYTGNKSFKIASKPGIDSLNRTVSNGRIDQGGNRLREAKQLSEEKQLQSGMREVLNKPYEKISFASDKKSGLSDSPSPEINSAEFRTGSGDSSSNDSSFLGVQHNKRDTVRVIIRRKDETKKQSWFHPLVYFEATPSLTYYKIAPDKSDDLFISRVEKDGLTSHNRLGFQLQGGFQHKLSESFDLFFGVSYFSQRQQFTYHYLSSDVANIQSSENLNYRISPGTATRSFNLNSRTAGVSAGVFYLLKESELSHRLGVGLQYQASFLTYESGDVPKKIIVCCVELYDNVPNADFV
jgi:hypothetical protein